MLRNSRAVYLALLLAAALPQVAWSGELQIPAFTAYMLPDPESAQISESDGVTRWVDPKQTVNWYGLFRNTGSVTVRVMVNLPLNTQSDLEFQAGETKQRVRVKGLGPDSSVAADFGVFPVSTVGYHALVLRSLNAPGQDAGRIESLILDGSALPDAHFNLEERRNAASVHLAYPVPGGTEVEAFYCEVTAIEDPVTTFYMACGWHRGYFGMQVNSPTERRIIFSVWDSGNEAVDRAKVSDENRVRLVAKGTDVYSGDFGNEGTGGHSHLKYLWKTGEKQKFVVSAHPVSETQTVFAGFWFHPDLEEWMLISAWKAPGEGGRLRGLHSFSENFGGHNGHLLRKARFGNQWIRQPDQSWTELTTATFSHDPTGKVDRFDRFMGVEDGQFFLSHGGFIDGTSEFGERFERPTSEAAPLDMLLPLVK